MLVSIKLNFHQGKCNLNNRYGHEVSYLMVDKNLMSETFSFLYWGNGINCAGILVLGMGNVCARKMEIRFSFQEEKWNCPPFTTFVYHCY